MGKDVPATGLTYLQLLFPYYNFYKQKSKPGTFNWPNTLAAATLMLQFLWVKKRKDVPMTGLTYLQLLPLQFLQIEKWKLVYLLAYLQLLLRHYNFYKQKNKNKYLQLISHTCSCCLSATIFTNEIAKTDSGNQQNIPTAAASAL